MSEEASPTVAPVVAPATPATPEPPAPASDPGMPQPDAAAVDVPSAFAPVSSPPADEPSAAAFEVPEAYRDKPWATNIKSIDDMWNQMNGAQELVGRKQEGLQPPGPDSTPESLEAWYKAGGRPESAVDYTFTLPEGVEGKMDDARLNEFRPIAHKYGLSQEQAEGIVRDTYANDVQHLEAHKQQQQDYMAEMVREWGGEEGYNANLGVISQALQQFGGEGLAATLVENGLDRHPEVMRFALRVGQSLQEATIPGQRVAQRTSTPEAAAREWAELLATDDNARAVMDPAHPKYSFMQEQKKRLDAASAALAEKR